MSEETVAAMTTTANWSTLFLAVLALLLVYIASNPTAALENPRALIPLAKLVLLVLLQIIVTDKIVDTLVIVGLELNLLNEEVVNYHL